MDRVSKKPRSTIHTRLRDIYDSPDYETTYQPRDALLELLDAISSQAHDLLDEAFNDVMAVLSLPPGYRKRLRTTNSIERLNQEIWRRERVIRIFPNKANITRMIGALLLDHHERWISGKAYFSMRDYLFEKDSSGLTCVQVNPEQQQVA